MRAPAHVTTTSTIDGWRVESYLGVVATHIVAGTGFGSDILAGLSDFFGGRSGAYQNQLASLYGEAVDQLYRKAAQLGGNWIIGLRVDIDEVSGKGMQMFMVTALGTAVRAIPHLDAQESGRDGAGRHAAALEVQTMQRRLEIGKAVRGNTLILDDPTWEFIIEQRVAEAAPAVLKWIALSLGSGSWEYADAAIKRRALAYFQSLPADVATHVLHEALCGEPQTARVALGIMRDLSLVSLRASLEALRSTNLDLRHRIVQALDAHQQSYEEADAAVMQDLISELSKAFPGRPDVIQTKSLLGGTKERWLCEACGNRNDLETGRCGKCERDPQGFFIDEVTPGRAIELLRERQRALSALLAHVEQPGQDQL